MIRPSLIFLKEFPDSQRGTLAFGEVPSGLPFAARRVFYMYDMPAHAHRGGHAHRTCEQFLICLHGRLDLSVASPAGADAFTLDRPFIGLYLPALSWVDIHVGTKDSICLVLASDIYDPADYVNDRAEFDALAVGGRD